jgi:hypothetical protein
LFTDANAVLAVSTGVSDHPASVALEAWDGEPGGYHLRGYPRGRAAIAGRPRVVSLYTLSGVGYFLLPVLAGGRQPRWA